MKKIVRLTESELKNIVENSVRRSLKEGVITEEMLNEGRMRDAAIKLAKAAGITVAAALAILAGLFSGSADETYTDPNANGVQQMLNNTKETSDINKLDAYHMNDFYDNENESRIRGAVMESIKKLMNGRL
jgi:hypothetical protein